MGLLTFLIGLITGSFISAYTYRAPRERSVVKGRSYCDKCGKPIRWYDNIPLISYLMLLGNCRKCGKKISKRYPLIEFITGSIFLFVYIFFQNCILGTGFNVSTCSILPASLISLPYLLITSAILISVFVVDIEEGIILDEQSFLLFMLTFIFLMLNDFPEIYSNLFAGFLAAFVLLAIHMVTKGKGMGLGDVKLAAGVGLFLGLTYSIAWLYISFILGAFVGLLLIFMKKAKFGKEIAFGPFLVISFFIILFWGNIIVGALFPFIK